MAPRNEGVSFYGSNLVFGVFSFKYGLQLIADALGACANTIGNGKT
jgi:hypothetical protein